MAKESNCNITNMVTQNIIDNISNPIFIFKNNNIYFVNKSLYRLFENKNRKLNTLPTMEEITSIFENIEEKNNFQSITNGKNVHVRYNYQDYSLKKVFVPTKSEISLDGIDDDCSMINLDNIASLLMQIKMMEYQSNKLKNYKGLVEELLAKELFKDSKKSIINAPITEDFLQMPIDDKLSVEEVEILRKSVKNKVTAMEFLIQIDEESLNDVEELKFTEEDMQKVVDDFDADSNKHSLFEMAKYFSIYGNIINSFVEFKDLGNAICSLSDFLFGLSEEEIKIHSSRMSEQFGNILEDLIQWRVNIFESKIAIDIHYLDSSLFSSVLQFQINMSSEAEDDDGGDLELF